MLAEQYNSHTKLTFYFTLLAFHDRRHNIISDIVAGTPLFILSEVQFLSTTLHQYTKMATECQPLSEELINVRVRLYNLLME